MLSPSGDIHPVARYQKDGNEQWITPCLHVWDGCKSASQTNCYGNSKGWDWIAYAQTDARDVPRLVIYSMGISASQDPPFAYIPALA